MNDQLVHKQDQKQTSRSEKLNWLTLARTRRLGNTKLWSLYERCGSVSKTINWLKDAQSRGKMPGLALPSADLLEKEWAETRSFGASMMVFCDWDYPALLAHIHDPPPVLTLAGDRQVLSKPAIAIVGARNASVHGCKFAKELAHDLAKEGFVIVSGLARGIDAAAHQGALEASGTTVAAIASGIDIAYPPENKELMTRISQTGCVVSERPFGAAPLAKFFPKRNRIIAGLAHAVIVVEAAMKSGSLMTANLALDFGREVMAVPGNPYDRRHQGTNRLIKTGAALIENAQDVMTQLPSDILLRSTSDFVPCLKKISENNNRKIPLESNIGKKAEKVALIKDDKDADGLSGRITAVLSHEPLLVDELIRQCHASASEVQAALLQLELEGLIIRHPGNRVSLGGE